MKTQIDMFSPLYYSSLGYDEELIDYISFIEDDQIRKLFPEPIKDPRGRKAWDAVILFRMHFLYFTKPEFVSFRQLCKELEKPKQQDYRNFIGLSDGRVPSHAALSRFRTALGLACDEEGTEQRIDEFFGPVPQGSKLQQRLLRFRKQSELNFALEANLLDGVFRHKKLPIRHIGRVETYLKLADVCRLIEGLRDHCHEKYVSKAQTVMLRQMAEQEIYGYCKTNRSNKAA